MSIPHKLGKYEVRRELGQGGMGVVYEGYDPVIERRVALKTIHEKSLDGSQVDDLLMRLRREAQAAGRLSHPNIVAIYEFGEEISASPDGREVRTAFIAMEFVDGRELASYFSSEERFPLPAVQRMMSELLDALEYSHSRGVVHRDIKPSNIILLADGTVKVADFGIARIESSTRLTQAGSVLGSPGYMAPEQFMGHTVDRRSDIYAAGVVLYQFLTGETPFTGSFASIMHKALNEQPTPPSALNVQVPTEFDAVIRRALAKRPDERFQSAVEFKQAILQTLSDAKLHTAGAAVAAAGGAPDEGGKTILRPELAAMAAPPRKDGAASLEAILQNSSRSVNRAVPVLVGLSAALLIGALATLAYRSLSGRPDPDAGQRPAEKPAAQPSPVTASLPAPTQGTATISAVGLANLSVPGGAKNATTAGAPADLNAAVLEDARRQLIEKAAALYVEPRSLREHYAMLREKLLARSPEFIQTERVEQPPAPPDSQGMALGSIRATVKIRDVQKSLNQISREQHVEFVRNDASPRLNIVVRTSDVDADSQPRRSAVAENLLKERIRSFGFVIEDPAAGRQPVDFRVDSEARFKKLSATLPASGVTIEKFALTSWTVNAVDAKTGEEIYHNTQIPQKRSWATLELALQDVGRMIGEELSRNLFLQHFDFSARKARLRFSGVPASHAAALFREVNAVLQVLNAVRVRQDGTDIVIDTELSGASDEIMDPVKETILRPLNLKLGKPCFSLLDTTEPDVRIRFDGACNDRLDRLEALPPGALVDAPSLRVQEVMKSPHALRKLVAM